ncbi:C-type lectin-like isoform X2 [Mobula hypostoma]
MMLVLVLVVTALLVSDVAGTHNSLELERTLRHLEKRGISGGPCNESWFYFAPLKSCYKFFKEKKTWMAAQDFCNQNSYYGQLASVNSSDHNTFISEVVSAMEKDMPLAWIGLNDLCKEGNFTWIDGSLYSYRNWAQNEPNDLGHNEDCVHIHHSGEKLWNDYPCNTELSFVCSYKLHCT